MDRFEKHQIPFCEKVLGNLGDVNPAEYGGGVVFQFNDGNNQSIECEYTHGAEVFGTRPLIVYRFLIEQNVLFDLNWVDWENIRDNWPEGWEPVEKLAVSEDPLDRAKVYEAVGGYYGFVNLDDDPSHHTYDELCQRWYGVDPDTEA